MRLYNFRQHGGGVIVDTQSQGRRPGLIENTRAVNQNEPRDPRRSRVTDAAKCRYKSRRQRSGRPTGRPAGPPNRLADIRLAKLRAAPLSGLHIKYRLLICPFTRTTRLMFRAGRGLLIIMPMSLLYEQNVSRRRTIDFRF